MMEVPTTSNENLIEYFDEAITTIEFPGQTSTRENDIKKSEKSDSEGPQPESAMLDAPWFDRNPKPSIRG